jgi:site-specific recombinase XerD
MVTSFLRHMKAENKSANTITAYRYAADGLAAFLADRGMPTRADAIKREHVEAYVQDLSIIAPLPPPTSGIGAPSSSSSGYARRAKSPSPR